MIKVLEPGRIKKCTCNNCGAILSYDEKEDILESSIPARFLGDSTGVCRIKKYIVCPQCKNEVILSSIR